MKLRDADADSLVPDYWTVDLAISSLKNMAGFTERDSTPYEALQTLLGRIDQLEAERADLLTMLRRCRDLLAQEYGWTRHEAARLGVTPEPDELDELDALLARIEGNENQVTGDNSNKIHKYKNNKG
jgi:hypothetical protein